MKTLVSSMTIIISKHCAMVKKCLETFIIHYKMLYIIKYINSVNLLMIIYIHKLSKFINSLENLIFSTNLKLTHLLFYSLYHRQY